MIIRKATLSDTEELSILFNNHRMLHKGHDDINACEQYLTERIKNEESVIFVAENNHNEIVGFAQLYPLFSSTNLKKLWLLNDLFVKQSHRGQGISILLIDETKKLCKETKAHGIILETDKTNTVGNKLYPRTGFKLDTEHNYYAWDNN